MKAFTLPTLSYSYDALEPFIDKQTMEFHHDKHHQTYLDKLNTALATHPELPEQTIEEILKNLNAMPEDIRMAVKNMGGGYYNHNLFFDMLAPGKTMPDALQKKIEESFGSKENFMNDFSTKAAGIFGSGWAWLIQNEEGKLEIVTTQNQDNPIMTRKVTELLALDVWEHAYYLKYQNRRPEFIANWWTVVNWDFVAARLK